MAVHQKQALWKTVELYALENKMYYLMSLAQEKLQTIEDELLSE